VWAWLGDIFSGFNGAATARSRNFKHEPLGFVEGSCFNGAATARSRNYYNLQSGELRLFELQWGRDHCGCKDDSEKLQWGRDRAVAELPPVN